MIDFQERQTILCIEIEVHCSKNLTRSFCESLYVEQWSCVCQDILSICSDAGHLTYTFP